MVSDGPEFTDPFSPEDEEFYFMLVYHKVLTKNKLSFDYHSKITSFFEKALGFGFGGLPEEFTFGSSEFKTVAKLRTSLYIFSAAKQYQQLRQMSAMVDEKTEYKAFREKAKVVFDEFNNNYLKTEYNTAVGQSQMARDWVTIEKTKDVLPYISYRTQRDSHVRDEHAILDGITLPVDDPFWNNYMPKNGWNCRCFTVQRERAKVTDLSERDLSELDDEKKFPAVFKMNAGKDGYIFDPKEHPYFKVARGDKEFKQQNFGMPIR
jgi:SPP1 gp7 family putative phage head morphogenesis protein